MPPDETAGSGGRVAGRDYTWPQLEQENGSHAEADQAAVHHAAESGAPAPPVAVGDTLSSVVSEDGSSITVRSSVLLSNDTDKNGDPLSVTAV